MNKEERIILDKFGKNCHFTVPEGYFDQLKSQVMERLPEPEAQVIPLVPTWRRYRAVIITAACSLIAVFGIGNYFQAQRQSSSGSHSMIVYESESNSFALDEAADYAMLDNNEIYASLADSNF